MLRYSEGAEKESAANLLDSKVDRMDMELMVKCDSGLVASDLLSYI
jgi:hypothetical protein